ncbi:LuxR C-terminal-related transcriptional regulator [Pseudonocardia sp. TMWB2A]|uniref:LuxR C-terminal-related transcriptional regulator n=1 Tax=Pseudonocardia sp. TMWB2A TaxID=687430 RepID=UPI00307FA3B5
MSSTGSRTGGHKHAVPKGHWNAIPRHGLLGRIVAPPHEPRLVVLHAPAGHGKTSVMVQAESACRARGAETAWLTLDGTDNDAARLHEHLSQVADVLNGGAVRESLSSGTGVAADLAAGFAAAGRTAAVFIDDLHFVHNTAALNLLADLTNRPVPGLRWFVGTRFLPPVFSSRLLLSGEVVLVDASALRFDAVETREFFDQSVGPRPGGAELRAIVDATEGWPAALQLYRLAYGSGELLPRLGTADVPSRDYLTEYLAEHVLGYQEPHIHDFLLATSVLDKMRPDLCDELLGRTDSADMLRALEQRGLFVRRLSSDAGWMTYHAIFSSFLRSHLIRVAPSRATELHRRAAAWFTDQQLWEEALRHRIEAGEQDAAADVFDRWLDELVPSGHMITVERWLAVFEADVLRRRPDVVVKILWALAFLSRHRKRDELLALWEPAGGDTSADPSVAQGVFEVLSDRVVEAERCWGGIDPGREQAATRFRTFELGVVCNGRGYRLLAEGDLQGAVDVLALGRTLNRRAGSPFALAYSVGKTALVRLSQGRATDALDLWAEARQAAIQPSDGSLSEACLVCGHIAGLYEAGELDRVLLEFERSRELIEVGAIHDYLVLAHRAVARTHALRGEPDAATVVLERGQGLAHAHQWPRAARLLAIEQARMDLIGGCYERAALVLGAPAMGGTGPIVRCSEETEDEHISAARLLVHTGRTTEALGLLAEEMTVAVRQGRVLRQIKLLVLTALAHNASGERRLAQRRLAVALDLAGPGWCVQGLLDEGDLLLELLDDHRAALDTAPPTGAAADRRSLLERLVPDSDDALPPSSERLRAPSAPHEPLTPREEQIVSMLSHSMTNDEIARASFVTTDTVKYHLKNIYAKLGARNRVDAVQIAASRQRMR